MRIVATFAVLIVTAGCSSVIGAQPVAPPTDRPCDRPAVPVSFVSVFRDSTAAAALLDPLVEAPADTVRLWVHIERDERTVSLDTAAVADSTARAALEAELVPLLATSHQRRRIVDVLRADDGSVRYEPRVVEACPPVMLNRDEMAEALNRAQAAVNGSGRVTIRIFVDTLGAATHVEVFRSSGNDYLDAAALGVGYVARFWPSMVNGKPIPVWAELPLTFVPQRQRR